MTVVISDHLRPEKPITCEGTTVSTRTFAAEVICWCDLISQKHPDEETTKQLIAWCTVLDASTLIEAELLAGSWPNVPPKVRAIIGLARQVAEAVRGSEEDRLGEEVAAWT